MPQYIDKSATLAEINRVIWSYDPKETNGRDVIINLRNFINTLEVKEVDLEKEYNDFVEEDPVYNVLVNRIVGKAIAKHFFELGLKAQKKVN